jgi:hypothetical protein
MSVGNFLQIEKDKKNLKYPLCWSSVKNMDMLLENINLRPCLDENFK